MTRLAWGELPPMFDQGVDQGVLYLGDTAVPWNGLVSVDESATGEVNVDHYFEGSRVHISHVTGNFEGRISAFTYPDAFAEYNGYSPRNEYRRFGLSYRTQHGLDSYKIHVVYGVLVRDGQRSWTTIGVRPDPSLFNWDISAEEQPVPGSSPASRLILEAPRDPDILKALEDVLYGTDTTDPRLPSPSEIVDIYEASTILRIVYNGDGTYTATGPDDMVRVLPDGEFEIDAPSAFLINHDIFEVYSY